MKSDKPFPWRVDWEEPFTLEQVKEFGRYAARLGGMPHVEYFDDEVEAIRRCADLKALGKRTSLWHAQWESKL